MKRDGWDTPARDELVRQVHSLAGTAATFGYQAVSDAAAFVERLLDGVDGSAKEPATERMERALQLLRLACLERACSMSLPSQDLVRRDASGGTVVVFDPKGDSAALRATIEAVGFTPIVWARAEEAGGCAQGTPVVALFIDLDELDGTLTDAARLGDLRGLLPSRVPLVALSSRADPQARLHAARAGATGFLQKPVTEAAMAELLDRCAVLRGEAARVLAIAGDAEVTRMYALVLGRRGISVMDAADAVTGLFLASHARPDLILIERALDGCDGFALTRAIRAQGDIDVPIVIVASDLDDTARREALRAGADEVLVRPVTPAVLVATVEYRLVRARVARHALSRDGSTRLLTADGVRAQLRPLLATSRLEGVPLSYALLVADAPAGDAPPGDPVLRLAETVRRSLRQGDVAGRRDKDGIAWILPGLDEARATVLIEGLQSALEAADPPLRLRWGLACHPTLDSAEALEAAAEAALHRVPVSAGGDRGTRPRILVVDDDAAITLMAEQVLRGEGFDVVIADDGPSGLEQAQASAPDLIVADVLLPRMDGFELCRRIRRHPDLRHVPVLMLTGVFRRLRYRSEAMSCGANDFLEKPVHPRQLVARIQSLLPAHA